MGGGAMIVDRYPRAEPRLEVIAKAKMGQRRPAANDVANVQLNLSGFLS